MENARLLEIQIERVRERSMAGSICKGRVLRVLPGMQAAFVDIGLEKAAFLPGADFFPMSADEYALREPPGDSGEAAEKPARRTGRERRRRRRARVLPPIEERLLEGSGRHRPDQQGADRHQGRARHVEHLAARPLPGVSAAQQPDRHLAPHRQRRSERQRLREAVEAVAPPRAAASSSAPPARACRSARSSPTCACCASCWHASLAQGRERCRRRRSCTQELDVDPAHDARSVRQRRHRASSSTTGATTSASSTSSTRSMPRCAAARRALRAAPSRSSTATASRRRSTRRSSARSGSSRAATSSSTRPRR